jgi:hypothetical protein
MNMNPTLYKNFINIEDSKVLCDFIDENLASFIYTPQSPTYVFRLGDHKHFTAQEDSILTENIRSILKDYSEKIVEKSKENFNVEESYMSQVWLVKKLPFSFHMIHDDLYDGDEHLQFSGVVYLNDNGIDGGGEIFFPKLNYEHKPEQGDMILFKSGEASNSHGVKLVKNDRYSLAFWTTGNKSFKINLD